MGTIRRHFGSPGFRERVGAAIFDQIGGGAERPLFKERRRRLLAAARGRVLDVGAGTGVNLAHYPLDRVTELVLLDVGRGVLARASERAETVGIPVELWEASAERLPFEDESFDSVVFTMSLCTIPDPIRALCEARRVLRPDGTLLLLQHVRARDPRLLRWQQRINPFWNVVSGGCHLDRDTRRHVETAGFRFDSVEEWLETRIPVPVVRPQLMGIARKAASSGPPPDPCRGR